MKQDVEYNLARLEAKFARMDYYLDMTPQNNVTLELKSLISSAKQFLLDLRLALDPHRIDVV